MGRESRNNPTAQQSNAGKLMSRQTFLGKVDFAMERHSLEIMLAHKRIEALEARVVVLEGLRNLETVELIDFRPEAYPPGFVGPKDIVLVNETQGHLHEPSLETIGYFASSPLLDEAGKTGETIMIECTR